MSKFVDTLEGINLSPPGVLGLAGVLDADLEAIKCFNRIRNILFFTIIKQ